MQDPQGLYAPYKGNTLNCAEASRFDFPEKTWTGQPTGVTMSGSSDKHHKAILTTADPSYLPSPTADLIRTQKLAMPEIRNPDGSPQKQLDSPGASNGSPSKLRVDQGAYLDRIRRQAEEQQQQIAYHEQMRLQMAASSNANHHLSLQQFNAAQAPINANLVQRAGMGNPQSSPNISPEKLQATAAKRNKQMEESRKITAMAAQEALPQGHAILLNKPQQLVGNPSTQQQGVLQGHGQVSHISAEQKLIQQAQFRQNVQDAAHMQEPTQQRAPPRQRPASPGIPIPGENKLMTMGQLDSADHKHQRLMEAKMMLEKQSQETQAFKAISGANPVLRSSDEYGMMSGRGGQHSGRPGQQGQYNLIINPKKVPVPERDPNAYFPSPLVREAKSRQHAAVASRDGFPDVNEGAFIGKQNYDKRKQQQEQYKQQMDTDRQAANYAQTINEADNQNRTGHISLQEIAQNGANNRNEAGLFSPIRSGANIIDKVGNYDYDHKDSAKKKEMQAEYYAQLMAAQQATVPVSQRQPLYTPQQQQQQMQANPYNMSQAEYFHKVNQDPQSQDATSLPVHGHSDYSGYSRQGFNAQDPAYQQMRAAELEKQADFQSKVEASNAAQPILSPRTMMYRKKYLVADGPDYDTSTPYGMLTNSLQKNEDLLEEKGIQEGVKKMSQQLRVQQLEADKQMHETARNTPQQRVSYAKPRKTQEQIDTEISENHIPSGLPMFNQYDWNQNSLDYTWNSNQQTNGNANGALSPRSAHAKAHTTRQMYYAQNGEDNEALTPTGQSTIAMKRYQQFDHGSKDNTSLPLTSLDLEKTVHAKNKTAYQDGMLSDRSELARQQYHEQLMQQQMNLQERDPTGQASYQQVPLLAITQNVPAQNPNYHNPAHGGAGLDPISGISALANGRQPQVPNSTQQRSSFPDPRRVGGEPTHPSNARDVSARGMPQMSTPSQTGFRRKM